ncbi:MAG: hypothetical protein V3S14_15565 [Anaerolineae bacterium]
MDVQAEGVHIPPGGRGRGLDLAPGDAVGAHRRLVVDGIGGVGDVVMAQPGLKDEFGGNWNLGVERAN